MKHIVKRRGHTEAFDDHKVYASVYASCLAVREPDSSAELIADRVTQNVVNWIAKKHEVTSQDIRVVTGTHLKAYHEDAAYMYLHHRMVW